MRGIMERRLYPRTPAQTRVRLYFNGSGRIRAHLNDFSQGGVAVTIDEYAHAPDRNDTIFMLADNMDEAFSMRMVRFNNREWVLGFTE